MKRTDESLFGDAKSNAHSEDDDHAKTLKWFFDVVHWYSPQFSRILRFRLFGTTDVQDLLINSLPANIGLGSDFFKDLKPDFENDIGRAQAIAKCYSY